MATVITIGEVGCCPDQNSWRIPLSVIYFRCHQTRCDQNSTRILVNNQSNSQCCSIFNQNSWNNVNSIILEKFCSHLFFLRMWQFCLMNSEFFKNVLILTYFGNRFWSEKQLTSPNVHHHHPAVVMVSSLTWALGIIWNKLAWPSRICIRLSPFRIWNPGWALWWWLHNFD